MEPEHKYVDVMKGAERIIYPVSKHGFVSLVDVMPRLVPEGQTADFAIVQAARVSYGPGTKTVRDDIGLIRYLMRKRHTSPFEMVEFKFHVSLPIFVARQWIRHRTANVNEISGRYSQLPDNFFQFLGIRGQDTVNKQGSEGVVDPEDAAWFVEALTNTNQSNYELYAEALKKGVSREIARSLLNLNVFTEWYWKLDLHNLMHFLKLRLDPHAQEEIRVYANAMFELLKPIVPITIEAFQDYVLNSEHFSIQELKVLKALHRSILERCQENGIDLDLGELANDLLDKLIFGEEERAIFAHKLQRIS